MSSKYALEVKNVSKSFRLPTEQASGIKQAVINRARGIKGYKEQHVLKDISFKVEKGDFFGIVGRNGSGKSTLLKLISQIYTPDFGSVKVNGTLVPFIELGVGFNPELTGRENVYMNGALLGFSKSEVTKMYPEIVEFAELEEFMDQKLKNYSSGMQVRLAFSIAIKAQGDILVLDEVLAVGDEAFQRKCAEFFAKIKRDKTKTVILVTHSMGDARKYCNKAIMINKGEIVAKGDPNLVADAYSEMFLNESDNKNTESEKRFGNGSIRIENIKHKLTKDKFVIDFDLESNTKKALKDVTIGFDFSINRDVITGFDTRYMDETSVIKFRPGEKKHISAEFDNIFGNHEWELDMNITTDLGSNIADLIKPALKFTSNNIRYHSVFKVLNKPNITISDMPGKK